MNTKSTDGMTPQNQPTQTSAEREVLYQSLVANYRPPVTLRTSHKKQLKTAWSIRQGYDGSRCECLFCHIVKPFGDLTVHHRDGNEEHNDPENLAPACYECNHREGWVVRLRKKAEIDELERKKQAAAPTPTLGDATGSQSERSPIQRARWLAWINDLKAGPFAQYELIAVKSLANWAPRAIARKELGEESLGVAQTYAKYIEQDSEQFGGPLHIFKPETGDLKGIICVEYVSKVKEE